MLHAPSLDRVPTGRPFLTVEEAPNKRLKLTGGDRSKGSGVCRPALMARPFVLLSLFALAASPSRLLTQDSLRRVVVDSYAFAYVDRGTGPAIVLVHGALTDYRTWTNQLDAFSQSYRVIAYSRRYHYPNSWVSGGPNYTYAQNVADLAGVIRALQLGPVHLVGHSWGASVALLFTLRHPELVRSLTLVEPGLDSLIVDAKGRAAAAAALRNAYARAGAVYREDDPIPALRALLDAWFGHGWFDRQPDELRHRFVDNARTVPLAAAPQPAVSCADLQRLRVPVLLIQGELSDPEYHAVIDGVGECVASAERVEIRGAPHTMHRTHTANFNAALLAFLQRH